MATKARARRTLWLLRHAKTVTDPPPGGADFDRVLAPRGRRDATALGRLFAGAGEGLGPSLKGVPRPEIALVSPAARTAATAELVLAGVTDPPRVPAREGPLRGRPRGGARLRAVPARRGQRRHGRGPQPHGAIALAGPPVGPRQEGPRQRGAARLPHLRARRLLLRPRPLGRRGRRNRQAGGHHDPAVPGERPSPTSAGWRRRPGRRRRTTPRLPWRRRGGAARAVRSARPGCPTCRPGDPAQWRRR